MNPENLFDDIPANLDEERTDTLLRRPGVRIERIVSRGHASPEGFWYDQAEDEWVILLAGAAAIAFEGRGEAARLRPGDYAHIPAHTRHRVVWTEAETDTVWLAVFHAPAGD